MYRVHSDPATAKNELIPNRLLALQDTKVRERTEGEPVGGQVGRRVGVGRAGPNSRLQPG